MKLLHFIIFFSLIVLLYYFYNTQIFEGFSNNSTVSCSIGKQFIKNKEMIIAVSYGPSLTYNVKKDQVNNVMIKIQSEYPHAKLCSRSDIQMLVNKKKPYCFCGWVKGPLKYNDRNTMSNYQSVYPSTRSTRSGCGGGSQRVINCGNISWAGGKSGIYVKLSGKGNEVISKLKNQGLAARIVWKSDKCYPVTYNNNFNVQTLKRKAIGFTTGERGANDYNIKGISLELALQMANENIYAVEYDPYNSHAIFRSYTSDGKVPPIRISYTNSFNLNLIPSRWNGKGKEKAKSNVSFSTHVGDSIYSRKGVNNIHIKGIRLDDAKSLIKDNTYAIVYKEKSGAAFLYSYDKNNKPPNDIVISEDKNSVVYTIDGRYHIKESIIDPFKYQQDKSVSSYISPIKKETNLDNYVIYQKPQKFNDRKCNMNIKKNCFDEQKYIDNNLGVWKNRGDESWKYFGKEKDIDVLNFEYNDVKNL